MENTEYYESIEATIDVLMDLRRQAISLAAGIIGESLLKEDLYFCAATDRCINLIDGIILMLRERNLTCAGALLRLQMDNCMRSYAAFIAQDKDSVVTCIINGGSINRLLSKDGVKMSDKYLRDEIAKIDNVFSDVYVQACGFIHLSEKAFYQTVVECDDNNIVLQIGHKLPERRNQVLIEAADAFVHFVKLQFKMLNAVAESKKRYDSQYNNEKEKMNG